MKIYTDQDHRKSLLVSKELWKHKTWVRVGGSFIVDFSTESESEQSLYKKIVEMDKERLDIVRLAVSKLKHEGGLDETNVMDVFLEYAEIDIDEEKEAEEADLVEEDKKEDTSNHKLTKEVEKTKKISTAEPKVKFNKRLTKHLIKKRLADEAPISDKELRQILTFLTNRYK